MAKTETCDFGTGATSLAGGAKPVEDRFGLLQAVSGGGLAFAAPLQLPLKDERACELERGSAQVESAEERAEAVEGAGRVALAGAQEAGTARRPDREPQARLCAVPALEVFEPSLGLGRLAKRDQRFEFIAFEVEPDGCLPARGEDEAETFGVLSAAAGSSLASAMKARAFRQRASVNRSPMVQRSSSLPRRPHALSRVRHVGPRAARGALASPRFPVRTPSGRRA